MIIKYDVCLQESLCRRTCRPLSPKQRGGLILPVSLEDWSSCHQHHPWGTCCQVCLKREVADGDLQHSGWVDEGHMTLPGSHQQCVAWWFCRQMSWRIQRCQQASSLFLGLPKPHSPQRRQIQGSRWQIHLGQDRECQRSASRSTKSHQCSWSSQRKWRTRRMGSLVQKQCPLGLHSYRHWVGCWRPWEHLVLLSEGDCKRF